MKHSFWGYFVVLCGVVIIVILLLVQRMTTTSEEDFYLAREVMEASMVDAVDYGTYRTTGKLVMSEQKFVEIFIRRFAENVTNNKTYKLEFYDIYEEPPKASVRVRTSSGNTANIKNTSFDVTLDTLVNGILETIYGQVSKNGDDGNGGNNVDNVTVSCPDGRNIPDVTPTLPDDIDNEDNDDSGFKWSGYKWYYSVGYIDNIDVSGSAPYTKSFNANYSISYKSLPLSISKSIQRNNINGCEIKADSISAFTSNSDIVNYRKDREDYGQYYIGGAGNATSTNASNIKYYVRYNANASKSEILNKYITCDLSFDSIIVNIRYSGFLDRQGLNIDIDPSAKYVDKNGNVAADKKNLVYTGIKWQLRFRYRD